MIRSFTAGAALLAAIAAAAPSAAVSDDGLQLEDCRIHAAPGAPGINARCGTFERPENPDDPASPVLELSVAVVPALSLEPAADPFVPIAGGPGGASSSFYAGYAAAFDKIRRKRDILLLDQRGTGKSARLGCDFGDEVIEGQLSVEETAALAEDCLDALPHDPRYFTTSVAVRDLEALRETLGYPALNLYGASYGTRVAQHYARRYPDTTRTVILDGVAPPQMPLGPGIAIEAEKALQNIFARCAENPRCAERYPDLADAWRVLLDKLRDAPVELRMAHPVNGRIEPFRIGDQELAGAIRLMSYSPNTVALIPLMISEAADGNFRPLAATFVSASESMSRQMAIGMHNAVVCTEDIPYYEEVDGATLASTYIGPVMTEALEAICSIWPPGVIDDDLHTPLKTELPVLLLSGSADPVTPPYFADLAAVDLGNARHLTGKNQGHGLAGQGCVPDIIGKFVETASVDNLGSDCMDRLFVMPFFLDFAGPAP